MLPDNIGFGRVRMRALLGVPDSPDDDDEFPEARGASGSVKFVPAVTRVVNITGTEPVTIGLPTIEGTFDAEGRLCGPDGVPGVYLIATDDTSNQPVNWTYKAQFAITGISIPSIDIHVPEGSDTDLTLITPVPSSPGVGQNQWEALVLRAEQAAVAAEGAVFSVELNGVVYTPDEDGVVTLVIEGGGGAELTSYVEQVASLDDYPTTFPPRDHDHTIADVEGLQGALDGKAPTEHTHTIGQVSGLSSALADLQPAGDYAPLVHSHGVGDVSGLQGALDGKQPSGDYATSQDLATGLSARADLDHDHEMDEVRGLVAALDNKQPAGSYATGDHTHEVGDVQGLQSTLDGKQAVGSYAAEEHSHAIGDVTGLQDALDDKQAAGSYATTAQLADKVDTATLEDRISGGVRFIGFGPNPPDPSGLPDGTSWLMPRGE